MGTAETVIGYVRVSTAEQGAHGAGLDAQKAAINAECERRGWTLLRIEEDVLSGKTLKRPGLTRALDACRSGEVAGVVVAKLDRLSRSVIDGAALLAEARKHGFNVVAIDLGVDLSTTSGKLIANVMTALAEWERDVIGDRTRDALAVRRTQGVTLGRPRVIDPRTRRRMRTLRARGWSFARIAEKLNDERVPTAHGGARWYPATVRRAVEAQR